MSFVARMVGDRGSTLFCDGLLHLHDVKTSFKLQNRTRIHKDVVEVGVGHKVWLGEEYMVEIGESRNELNGENGCEQSLQGRSMFCIEVNVRNGE